jgi:glycerol-3-phosphate dehydrogenase
MTSAASDLYDVAVVGAGVVGAAVARELAQYPLRVVLVEEQDDVGAGTSKANTALLHTGFDSIPGTLEARLVREGHALLARYAIGTGIAMEALGGLLVAWSDEQQAALTQIADRAGKNECADMRLLSSGELRVLEPHLGAGARGALEVPGEAIICPWTPPLAYATQAVRAGVHLRLGTRVGAVRRAGEHQCLETSNGALNARWVVNAAGLWSDELDRSFGHARFTVTPRRGELIVFDKLARRLVQHILLPVPTERTKGVLVTPTVFGNVLLGPTADDLQDKRALGSTASGVRSLLERGRAIVPELVAEEVTAVYAGLRSATEHADYTIEVDREARYAVAGGIRSTGLSASLAIARYLVELLAEAGLALGIRRELEPVRMPPIGELMRRPFQDGGLIASDPEYGRIVCHCERVSRGEVRDAFSSTIPPVDVGGLKRRTRATMGRCQGFYCGAAVRALSEGR